MYGTDTGRLSAANPPLTGGLHAPAPVEHDYAYNGPDSISLVLDTLTWGRPVNSRYGPCIEIQGGRYQADATNLVTRPKINYSLGWMELMQLIAGVFDPGALQRVAPNADHSLFTYPMAYGPRLAFQIEPLLSTLMKDPGSRQAVLFVGNPSDGMTSNLPCTLTMQFLVRDEELHTVVSMRSWDLCRGLPYDIMMFGGLNQAVARCLQLMAGSLIVHAGSSHIYESQLDKLPVWSSNDWYFDLDGPQTWPDFVEWARQGVRDLKRGETPGSIVITK